MTPTVTPIAMVGENVVHVTAAVADVAGMSGGTEETEANVLIAQKVAARVEMRAVVTVDLRVDLKAARTPVPTAGAMTAATTAKSRASHARRVKRVNPESLAKFEKAAVPTVQGGIVTSAATSSAPRWIRWSRTLLQPTKPRWQLPWAAR